MSAKAEPPPLGLPGKAHASSGPRTLAHTALPAPPTWRGPGSPGLRSCGVDAAAVGPWLRNGTARPLPSLFWAPHSPSSCLRGLRTGVGL